MLNVKSVHLELINNAVPYYAQAFLIPQSMEAKVHKEMECLALINVFSKDHDSEWAVPTFTNQKNR
jgi:hypothetical protein